MEQIQAPARMMRQRYDNNAAKVNALIDWTFELKKNKTDNEFQRQIDDYYKVLKSYYDNNLDLARMDTQIKQVELGIKEAIDAYNKRVETANNNNQSNNVSANNSENFYIQAGLKDWNDKKYEDAYSDFKKAIELNPNNPGSYVYVGMLEADLKHNNNEAVNNFTKAINLNSTFTNAYIYRADMYKRINKDMDALNDLKTCLKLEPKNTFALFMRSEIKSKLGDYLGGIDDCELVLNYFTEPFGFGYNLSDVNNQIAWCHFLNKNNEKCLEFSNIAIKQNPKNYNAIDTRGCAFYELGEYTKCISDMSKAIEINSESKNSYYYRGLAYIKTKNIDLARKDFSKAGELGEEKAYEAIRTYCK
jgi:tetratricopeptide (TPR) repeat protein